MGTDMRALVPLTDSSGILRAEFGYSTATEIGELYRALAVTCIQKRIPRVVIVAGDDDAAGEWALRDALAIVVLAGIPDDFRLALVTSLPRVARAYGNAYRDLNAAGVKIRLFEREEDALHWLHRVDTASRDAA